MKQVIEMCIRDRTYVLLNILLEAAGREPVTAQ